MENFDAMTNDEIRLRLLQYGLPNMPVTDTTRKVLVKKLKLAVEGQKTKTRRETVAVSKFSSDEDPEPEVRSKGEKTPRRATIAVAEKKKSLAANGTEAVKTVTRRLSRNTPAKEKPAVTSTTAILEDTDDDIIEVPVTRRSKTPTLVRSNVVRTSHTATIRKIQESTEEASSDDEPLIQRTPPKPVIEQTTTTRRKTFTTSGLTSNIQERSTPTKFGKTSFSTSFNPGGNYQVAKEVDEYENEPMVIDESNAPYLSNFAKRLSVLKADPIDVGINRYSSLKDPISAPTTSYQTYQSSYGYKSNPITAHKSSQGGLLKATDKVYDKLDQKFNFRTILFCFFIVMLLVAIYVILM